MPSARLIIDGEHIGIEVLNITTMGSPAVPAEEATPAIPAVPRSESWEPQGTPDAEVILLQNSTLRLAHKHLRQKIDRGVTPENVEQTIYKIRD